MRYKYILFFIILLTACRQKRQVKPTFYYWKTIYTQSKKESDYLNALKSDRIYVRIMDVDVNEIQQPIPVAPINFKSGISRQLQLIPVVYMVNNVLKNKSGAELEQLAHHILEFVSGKVLESGKMDYTEIQMDCDWTQTTREPYFSLLKLLKKFNKKKKLSCTLRLHQLKNQLSSGIPPVDKVLLMCYNMGNLRKYGNQNSILDVAEFKKYVDKNLINYPKEIDVALPLFSWSVVFKGANYAGISKRISLTDLENHSMFQSQKNGMYLAKIDLPSFGIEKNNTVRFEESKLEELKEIASYLSSKLSEKSINLVYYHLDQNILKKYSINELEEVNHMLR